jgi:hypothetical protein
MERHVFSQLAQISRPLLNFNVVSVEGDRRLRVLLGKGVLGIGMGERKKRSL